MRAVGVTRHGGPEVLEVLDLPDPQPGPGEVLVRVHAATVNPTDTWVRSGDRGQEAPLPHVPGMEVAGVLDAIGEGVTTDLQVGDRVMGIVLPTGAYGAYSELVALSADSVAASPAGASHVEAATLPMNGLTARLALDRLDLSEGDTLAVTGAAGAFGGYVVQLARQEGLRVIADAAAGDVQLVQNLGAHVVVPRGDDVAAHIRKHAPDGVDGLADGSIQNEALFPAVRDGGGFAAVRGLRTDTPRGIRLLRISVRHYLYERDRLDRLGRQVEEGVLTLRVAATFPPERAAEAHRRLEAGGVRGRLVIEFRGETPAT